jgi:RND family efflux transporter MFP subunit
MIRFPFISMIHQNLAMVFLKHLMVHLNFPMIRLNFPTIRLSLTKTWLKLTVIRLNLAMIRLTISIFVVAMALAACAGPKAEEENGNAKDKSESKIRLRVPLSNVEVKVMSEQLTLPGVVFALPDFSVKVSPGVSGKIVEVKVSPGQKIAKGQIIALLDNRQLLEQLRQAKAKILVARAGVEQAKTNLILAQSTEARTQSLVDQDVGAIKDLIAAKSQIETSKAQLVSAEAQVDDAIGAEGAIQATLTYTVVKSPISGIVAQRYLNVSDTADGTTPIVQIVNLDQVIVDAALPSSEPAHLNPGEKAIITANALPDQHIEGTINSINPVTDNQGTTIGVRILCSNPNHALKEGMPVSVSIVTAVHPRAVVVPLSALVADPQSPTQQMVYVCDDGKIVRHKISTGIQTDNAAEVISGLHAGQQIVTSGAYGIPDGTEVEASK